MTWSRRHPPRRRPCVRLWGGGPRRCSGHPWQSSIVTAPRTAHPSPSKPIAHPNVTAVLPQTPHSNCCKRVSNRPLRGRRCDSWSAGFLGERLYVALVLGRFSVVTCITRRGLIWASPRRLPGSSIPPRDPVAAGWPAAGCASPPTGDDGRLQVVAHRPLLGGAPLPDTSAVSPRTLPSGGVHGSLFFRFPSSSLPNRFASLHICRFGFLFSGRGWLFLASSLLFVVLAQPNQVKCHS